MNSEIERRLNNIIALGRISEIDEKKALVRVDIVGRVTDWLPVFMIANTFKRHWVPPRIKEQVVVLQIGGDGSNGLVLRSIFWKGCPEPGEANGDIEITEYSDGSRISYDVASSTALLNLVNALYLYLDGNLTVDADGKISVKTGKSMKVEASDSIQVETPVLQIEADTVEENATHLQTGDIWVTGNVYATGDILAVGSSDNHHSHKKISKSPPSGGPPISGLKIGA